MERDATQSRGEKKDWQEPRELNSNESERMYWDKKTQRTRPPKKLTRKKRAINGEIKTNGLRSNFGSERETVGDGTTMDKETEDFGIGFEGEGEDVLGGEGEGTQSGGGLLDQGGTFGSKNAE